jgi:hypothetical protein
MLQIKQKSVAHCEFIPVLSLLLSGNIKYYVTSNGCFISRQSLEINCSLGAILNIRCIILQVKMTRNMFPALIIMSNDCIEMPADVRTAQDAVVYKKKEGKNTSGKVKLKHTVTGICSFCVKL